MSLMAYFLKGHRSTQMDTDNLIFFFSVQICVHRRKSTIQVYFYFRFFSSSLHKSAFIEDEANLGFAFLSASLLICVNLCSSVSYILSPNPTQTALTLVVVDFALYLRLGAKVEQQTNFVDRGFQVVEQLRLVL